MMLMRSSNLSKLTAVCLISSLAPRAMALSIALEAAQAVGLLGRDSSCSGLGLDSNYTTCGQGLPSSFCCDATVSTCIPFNGGLSAICCPKGESCASFGQLDCSLAGFNVTAAPNSPLHSTELDKGMVQCGSSNGAGKCCPNGYTCGSGDGLCHLATASTSSAATTSSVPGSASSATISISAIPSPTAAAPAAAATTHNFDESCNAYPVSAVLVGFFPGLVLGIVLTIFIIVCLGRRRDPDGRAPDTGRPPPAKAVSDPIYHDQGATRVDFLRRLSRPQRVARTPKMFSPPSPRLSPLRSSARVRSLFSTQSPSIGSRTAVTNAGPFGPSSSDPRQLRREPSMLSVKIYSPESTFTRNTTYDDVMAGAGSGDGRGLGLSGKEEQPFTLKPAAYLGSPGRSGARGRGVGGGWLR